MATSHPSKQQIKYKKIVLTGLQIPQPPPSLQTLSQPHQKQQQIQNSSSSSEQQVYYQNYFQNKLNNIIEGLLKQIELGNKIPWEILQVNQNQQIKGQHQYVDVVLKVAVNTQQSLRLNENIQKIKAANKQLIKQKQRLNKNFKKKKQVYQNSTKIVQKAQKKLKKVKKQQKLKSDHKIKELDSDRFIMQETSQDLNQMVSNSSNIVQINQKNYQQAKTNHNIKSNVTNESQSQLQQQNQEQNTQQSNDSKDQLNNIQIPQKSNKLCLILIVILIVSVVVGTRIYLSSLDVNQMTKQTLQNPAIKKDSSDNYGRQNGDIIYYFGEISAIAKKQNYFIPLQIKDQNLKIPLYIQMLPKVNKPQESLHPRNLSYIRPTLTQILSFPHIYFNQSIKNSTDFAHKILDIDEAENKKIDGYLKSLGKTEQEIMINLYTQMHKNPNSSFLLQAQYIYLSTKYQTLANISKSIQKPLCIVAYSPQSLYKQQKFLPFFQSLFNQNYTNYRLLYIDDGPTDKYNNARIMNYLWDKHYYSMGNINIFNLNFVRFDEKIGKIVGIGAVVRELCADGEIVVEIDADSGFIGRQALKIISAVYDGGHQKMILGPKNQPFFNPHYQTQPNDRSTQSNLKIDESKIKKKIMFIKADDKQKSSKNKQFSQRIDNKDDDMIVIEGILRSRYVGNIWLAYSNYLQIDQQNQLIPKIDQQIKISQKQTNLNFKLINMKQVIQQNYEFISSPNIEQDLLLSKQSKSNARKLSNMCFKTYAIQLHHKLPLNSLLPKKYQSSPLFIQIQVYSYNFKQLISLLQMAGKFTTKNQPQQKKIKQKQNKIRNSQHYVQINEPLCFRTYKNKQQNDECKFKIQIFAQLSAISRDQLKQLQNLGQKSGDISKQKLQLTQKIRKNLEKLERQILQLCQL